MRKGATQRVLKAELQQLKQLPELRKQAAAARVSSDAIELGRVVWVVWDQSLRSTHLSLFHCQTTSFLASSLH